MVSQVHLDFTSHLQSFFFHSSGKSMKSNQVIMSSARWCCLFFLGTQWCCLRAPTFAQMSACRMETKFGKSEDDDDMKLEHHTCSFYLTIITSISLSKTRKCRLQAISLAICIPSISSVHSTRHSNTSGSITG